MPGSQARFFAGVIGYGTQFLRGFALGMPFLCMDFLAVGVFQACGMGMKSFAKSDLHRHHADFMRNPHCRHGAFPEGGSHIVQDRHARHVQQILDVRHGGAHVYEG